MSGGIGSSKGIPDTITRGRMKDYFLVLGKHKVHKLKSNLHSAAAVSPLSHHNTVFYFGSRKLLEGKTLWGLFNIEYSGFQD